MINKLKCLFGHHKFEIPYDSPRFITPESVPGGPGTVKMCSICRQVAALFYSTLDTVWQLDEDEQPISWTNSIRWGKYINDQWING